MSISTYGRQVSNLEKEIAGLQKKAGEERAKAAKERQAATGKLRGITRNTSDSQRLSKEKEAARYEEHAAKHEVKAADFADKAAKKGEQLQRARVSLQRAQETESRRDQTKRKRELDQEKRELQDLERRRRAAQQPPSFEPRVVPLSEAVRARPPQPRGEPVELGDGSSSTEAWPTFDVCLSFAGEQRGYVELIARGLKARGYRVFYDADEQAALWGKDLAEFFDYVYRQSSRVCVMFISAEYAQKSWTKHERRSALARALEEEEYVLPARFDDTELPGLSPTIGYVDLTQYAPESVVELLAEKLGDPADAES